MFDAFPGVPARRAFGSPPEPDAPAVRAAGGVSNALVVKLDIMRRFERRVPGSNPGEDSNQRMKDEGGRMKRKKVRPRFSLPPSSFILGLTVPVVERRPRERAKLEVQVRFLAGAFVSLV